MITKIVKWVVIVLLIMRIVFSSLHPSWLNVILVVLFFLGLIGVYGRVWWGYLWTMLGGLLSVIFVVGVYDTLSLIIFGSDVLFAVYGIWGWMIGKDYNKQIKFDGVGGGWGW